MLKVGRINFSFAAAHRLPNHGGACRFLHGHNYKLEVEFHGQINATGMIADFQVLKGLVQKNITQPLDHTNLNELKLKIHQCEFPSHNPTAELMVLWMVPVISRSITVDGNLPIALSRIRLWETENSYVEWTKD